MPNTQPKPDVSYYMEAAVIEDLSGLPPEDVKRRAAEHAAKCRAAAAWLEDFFWGEDRLITDDDR